MRRLTSRFSISLLFLLLSHAGLAAGATSDILINAAESFEHHYSGGLGVMIDAYAAALSKSIALKDSSAAVSVAMPFYMSFYDKPDLINSLKDEGRELKVGLDYHYDPIKKEMRPKQSETFHVYSRQVGHVKMLFYRHMNAEGEGNFFDNKVNPGERKRYTPDDREMHAFAAYDKALAQDILFNLPKVGTVIENDWHTGPNAYFLKHPERFGSQRELKILSLFHNLAYQGQVHDAGFIDWAGMDHRDFHPEGIAHGAPARDIPDHLNFMKMLANYSDMTATVSTKHASEGITPRFGKTLEGVNARNASSYAWTGVLNGIDYEKWNPEKAGHYVAEAIAQNNSALQKRAIPTAVNEEDYSFSEKDLAGKAKGKEFLQSYFNLPSDPHALVIGFTSRLDKQKGFEYIPQVLDPKLLENPHLQVIVIGDGTLAYRNQILALQKKFPRQIRFENFSSTKEELILSFADAVGAFSEHEPSGQVHTAAMRMATVPLATEVGGHAEAIVDRDGVRTGFLTPTHVDEDGETVHPDKTAKSVSEILDRASDTYFHRPKEWREIAQRAATVDFSWTAQVKQHEDMIEFMNRDGPRRLEARYGKALAGHVYSPSQLLKILNAQFPAHTPEAELARCIERGLASKE